MQRRTATAPDAMPARPRTTWVSFPAKRPATLVKNDAAGTTTLRA
jgi:hypothetical protein